MTAADIIQMPLGEQVANVAAMGGGAGAGFFIVKWFVEWLAGRMDKREARLDATTQGIIDRLDREVTRLSGRVEVVEGLLADCQKQHASERARRMEMEAILTAKGIIDQKAQQVIAADRLTQQHKGEA